jgi:hypothetical protein
VDLAVTYGWQYFSDADVDGFVDAARSWLRDDTVDLVPDGLDSPLVKYAASPGARRARPQVHARRRRAGDAEVNFSATREGLPGGVEEPRRAAKAERDAFSQKPERSRRRRRQGRLAIDPYQPRR